MVAESGCGFGVGEKGFVLGAEFGETGGGVGILAGGVFGVLVEGAGVQGFALGLGEELKVEGAEDGVSELEVTGTVVVV